MKQEVLLVEDNESRLASFQHLLSSEAYEVVLAENVQHAVARSGAGGIDLLLMNLDSPTEGEWEAIDEITRENPFLPVIVILSPSSCSLGLAETAGACAFVEKPVDVPMLLQMIRELLAEPVQRRVARACNRLSDFRHVPSSSGAVRDLLHRRSTASFRYCLPTSRWGINE